MCYILGDSRLFKRKCRGVGGSPRGWDWISVARTGLFIGTWESHHEEVGLDSSEDAGLFIQQGIKYLLLSLEC